MALRLFWYRNYKLSVIQNYIQVVLPWGCYIVYVAKNWYTLSTLTVYIHVATLNPKPVYIHVNGVHIKLYVHVAKNWYTHIYVAKNWYMLQKIGIRCNESVYAAKNWYTLQRIGIRLSTLMVYILNYMYIRTS
jgi:hypothetical protein